MSASILYARQLVSRGSFGVNLEKRGERPLVRQGHRRIVAQARVTVRRRHGFRIPIEGVDAELRTGRLGKNQNIFAGAVWKKENGRTERIEKRGTERVTERPSREQGPQTVSFNKN